MDCHNPLGTSQNEEKDCTVSFATGGISYMRDFRLKNNSGRHPYTVSLKWDIFSKYLRMETVPTLIELNLYFPFLS